MLLYTLNLAFLSCFFAIYPVAYGVGFTLLGLPMHSQMDFKLQTTTQSGRTIFQSTQAHWVWVDA